MMLVADTYAHTLVSRAGLKINRDGEGDGRRS